MIFYKRKQKQSQVINQLIRVRNCFKETQVIVNADAFLPKLTAVQFSVGTHKIRLKAHSRRKTQLDFRFFSSSSSSWRVWKGWGEEKKTRVWFLGTGQKALVWTGWGGRAIWRKLIKAWETGFLVTSSLNVFIFYMSVAAGDSPSGGFVVLFFFQKWINSAVACDKL